MGRPKQHDDATREALLAAAENLVERGGIGALSVRAVADEIGTTTRAVYSTFGSKEGLLAALAKRSFDMLHDAIAELPHTKDPARDLVQAALTVFRPMAGRTPIALPDCVPPRRARRPTRTRCRRRCAGRL